MRKFTIYSQRLQNYFSVYQGKGLYWSDNDFGELDKARLYKSEAAAMEKATGLHSQFDTVVVPVDLVPDYRALSNPATTIQKNCDQYMPTVSEIDNMCIEDRENLSNTKWNEYKRQKQYLLAYSEEYQQIVEDNNRQFLVSYHLLDLDITVDDTVYAANKDEACKNFKKHCAAHGVRLGDFNFCDRAD